MREKSAAGFQGGKVALYRRYRPTTLGDVIGQPQVTDILAAAAGSGQFAHAYLFTGQRGTGKTSTARILAHLINQTPYDIDNSNSDLDIIEIDAASRGSVDDARELRDKSAIAPVAAPYKIYIIDEVHMLSTPAFNALLKIIEEPPAHIVFILATTEIQKVPATILSRVQRFHFRPVATEIMAAHLRQIADLEKIKVDDEALNLIAERGQGSFRDSISLLDQLSNSDSKITRTTVEEILGLAPETAISAIIDAITAHDTAVIVATLNNLFKDGVAPSLIVDQLIGELSKLAPEKPKLYDLIEKLLEVAKSSAPDIKLTAILCSTAAKNAPSVTVAATAAPPRIDNELADIIEEKIAEEEQTRRETLSSSDPSLTEEVSQTHPVKHGKVSLLSSQGDCLSSAPQSLLMAQPSRSDFGKLDSEILSSKTENVGEQDVSSIEIVWDDVLSEVKNLDEPAVLATLKFADFDYSDGQITFYFSKPFHRKKADTAKFRNVLVSVFQKLYEMKPKITISTSAVRENSATAKILDIMGGGEVVRNGKA